VSAGASAALSIACTAAETPRAAAPPSAPERIVVNRATRGMATQVRWLLSPDSSALLVIDDPVGAEGEPIPDAVLLAAEGADRTWRMDSVWTAVPSPDWRHVAVGRAVVLGGGEQQRVDPARWEEAARSLARLAGPQPALVADSLRAHVFPASGMAVRAGVAATFVADVGAQRAHAPLRFVTLGGWRLAWSRDGADLLVGDAPSRADDDAPSASERRVSSTGSSLSRAPRADSLAWTRGPVLHIAAALPAERVAPLRVRGRMIEAREGRVVVTDARGAAMRDVGPGRPLAATRDGRFILAIAPRSPAQPSESPDEVIVYRVP
jgi:hypothetical protein